MSASTLNPSVVDQIRQFPGCRCNKLADKSQRLLETLLRENPSLKVEINDCGSGHARYSEATALCSRTTSGNLRVRFIRNTHKLPFVISGGRNFEEMLKALRTAARSHSIQIELN